MKTIEIEEETLARARQLEEDALTAIVKQCYPFIFRYFYYRAISRPEAEDLTSEVFVRVVTSIKGQKGNFPAWIFRIARNLLIDYYRKRQSSKESSLEQVREPISNSDPEDSLSLEDVRKLLGFLTEEQKEVMTLKFMEGYSNEEIAKIVNKSVGAIKALQFRALSSLRGLLKEKDFT